MYENYKKENAEMKLGKVLWPDPAVYIKERFPEQYELMSFD